jgi:hypothetical protein
VCTVIVSCGVVVGILFLEETHVEKKHRRDPGLEAGKWILARFTRFCRCADAKSSGSEKSIDPDDVLSLLSVDDQPSGYSSTNAGSPSLRSTPSSQVPSSLDIDIEEHNANASRSKPAVSRAFTRQVVLNIVGYGILA